MASVSNDPNGRRRILFVAPDESRKTIRLGKIDRKSAEAISRHVEALLAAKIGGQSVPRDTAAWLGGIGASLHDKLEAVGLIEPLNRLTVEEFTVNWLADKTAAGFKPTSIRAWGQTAANLNAQFGQRALSSVSHADGEAFRAEMSARGLRSTTIHKRLGHARQILEDAVRLGHLAVNPWKYVRHRAGDPSERRAYVPVAHAERVLEYCPDVWWRLLVALARYGGLRIPSEAFSLTWGDVDWERNRLCVPSPKTENTGNSHRVIPLFPLLRPHLEAAFEIAAEGEVHVFPEDMRQRASGPMGWGGANLRTTLGKIVRRAGVEPWPRIWHSLRASCESDLAQSFPLATVTKWLGNTPSVALRHYVDPTEVAFDRALHWRPAESGGAESSALGAQNTAQQVVAESSTVLHELTHPLESHGTPRNPASPCDIMNISIRECMGIEPTESFVQTLQRL
jgi:integrase